MISFESSPDRAELAEIDNHSDNSVSAKAHAAPGHSMGSTL